MNITLNNILVKNDKRAYWVISILSVVVFLLVILGGKFTIPITLPFNKHIFALINASLNGTVAVLLIIALLVVKQKKYNLHRNVMFLAILLSSLFLLSYVAHHMFTNPTKFGDANHDNIVDTAEKAAVGFKYNLYYLMLLTHIPMAGIILPFILLSAYRASIGEYAEHKKLVRFTWPLWFYVAITGVLIYIFIAPYYN